MGEFTNTSTANWPAVYTYYGQDGGNTEIVSFNFLPFLARQVGLSGKDTLQFYELEVMGFNADHGMSSQLIEYTKYTQS